MGFVPGIQGLPNIRKSINVNCHINSTLMISINKEKAFEKNENPIAKNSQQTRNTKRLVGFPGSAVVENLPAGAGDTGSSVGLGRSHMPRSN